ncbi:uncharacterized protein LOC122304796, partial [Carya illinoinensis]|uniref:uncharacterized protein LOC122304796 n=1 Tax=Carya illinoinensis TaxID=32201 RepID=UPI001C725B78
YPQRFQKQKLDKQFSKFLDIFKKIHINIPFADALEQMPNYVKFLKDIISKKRRLEEFETVKLSEECSAILQKKLPQKLKDPGSFTLPCTIGNSFFDKVLCDLGASINLMPLSVCRKLGLEEMKPTTISLQLADRSIKYPRGIIEDVLVKVDKFIFPADFVVLDMEEDEEVPLILGRPFLATGRALIDVQKGELTLRVNKEEVMFNIYQAMRGKRKLDDICTSDHIGMQEMALMIRVKYDKFWGDFSRSTILLYVVVVLDPQFKIDGVVYGLGIAHRNAWSELIVARNWIKKTPIHIPNVLDFQEVDKEKGGD